VFIENKGGFREFRLIENKGFVNKYAAVLITFEKRQRPFQYKNQGLAIPQQL